MNESKRIAVLWGITIFCFVLVWKTYLVDKNSIESFTGAGVFGGILFSYFCWFVYDTFVSGQRTTLLGSIKYNFKNNATVWAMCCYWVFFIFFVVDALVLHINNG